MNNWRNWALCAANQDPDLWFADNQNEIFEAQRICSRCPVRATCLNDALANEGTAVWGVRGGLTKEDRRVLLNAGRSDAQRILAAQKQDVRTLTLSGHSAKSIARDLGIDPRTVHRWRRELRMAA